MSQNFTTPVGRLVMGSLSKPQTVDAEGKPIVIKSGPNAGKPGQRFFIALAIPKGSESHWNQTPWGMIIAAKGKEKFPQAHLSPSFAWKVVDGDSQVPNKRGRKPCDTEGFKGHWVLNMSSSFLPKAFNATGSEAVPADQIKLGYYVQVNADVDGNGSATQPGVFLNPRMVALAGFGPEVIVGPDPASAGFGQAPLPAGASPTPLAALPTSAPSAAVPTSVAAPPNVSLSNPAFLQVPPPVPVRRMTAKASGATYEQLIALGWNDALLVQHGLMEG